jgi:arylsulfatase A-like enzyme
LIGVVIKNNFVSILLRSYLAKYKYIIHIVIDGISADHLGCYGYDILTSPNIDRLAEESIVCKNLICQRNRTLPSLVSMFTSTYPITNGIRENGMRVSVPLYTFPELLADKGYNIFYVEYDNGDPLMNPTFRNLFERINFYDERTKPAKPERISIIEGGIDFNVTNKVLEIIDKNREKPFYLFTIYNEAHNFRDYGDKTRPDFVSTSYYDLYVDKNYTGKFVTKEDFSRTEKDLDDEDVKYANSFYDAKIRFIDDQIGVIIDKLKNAGMWSNTILVIHADHGENIYDYELLDREKHAYVDVRTLYDKGIRVPLIIKIPDYKHKVLEGQLELIDLVPTLIDIIGLSFSKKVNQRAEGQTFLPLIRHPNSGYGKKYVFVEGSSFIFSIRTNEWKYICVPEVTDNRRPYDEWIFYEKGELYNLKADPDERKDLALIRTDIRDEMRNIFNSWYISKRKRGYDFSDTVPAGVKRFMEETGYPY